MTDQRALEIARIAKKCVDAGQVHGGKPGQEDRVAEGEESKFFVQYLKILLAELPDASN